MTSLLQFPMSETKNDTPSLLLSPSNIELFLSVLRKKEKWFEGVGGVSTRAVHMLHMRHVHRGVACIAVSRHCCVTATGGGLGGGGGG